MTATVVLHLAKGNPIQVWKAVTELFFAAASIKAVQRYAARLLVDM